MAQNKSSASFVRFISFFGRILLEEGGALLYFIISRSVPLQQTCVMLARSRSAEALNVC